MGTLVRDRAVALVYGILCHALFIGAVGQMIYAMYFGMQPGLGRHPQPWNWVVDALLLAQFPLGHSLMLTRRGKAWLNRLAPRDRSLQLQPTSYVIAASLQAFALFAFWSPSGVIWWEAHGLLRLLITLLYAGSWILLAKAIWDAGWGLQTGAIGWLAVFRGTTVRYPGLPVGGLFRLCRQPIYLAFILTLWTVPVWSPDQLAVAIALTAYCILGPLLKEARFEHIFGEAFVRYRAAHPYLVPQLRAPIVRNDLSIYDRFAEHWWDGTERWLRLLQNLVPARLAYFSQLTTWKDKDVLDLGCGGGFLSEALALEGSRVTGVDPAADAIAVARRHATHHQVPASYIVGTGENIPLSDCCMDIVICVDVLEHVQDPRRVIAEVRRVLRPGGLFLFDTINRNWLSTLVMIGLAENILRLVPRGTHDPAKFIKPLELNNWLRDCGFSTGACVGLGPRGIDRRLDLQFGWLPVNWVIYASHARKLDA